MWISGEPVFCSAHYTKKREFSLSCIYSLFLSFIYFKDLIIFNCARVSVWKCAHECLKRPELSDSLGWIYRPLWATQCEWWELNLVSLQEQFMPLTTELSLQAPRFPIHIAVDSCFIQWNGMNYRHQFECSNCSGFGQWNAHPCCLLHPSDTAH